MEKVTYTPAEFAEVFGKERTWGYRQLYAGKVKAITSLGRTMIPKSEVDRLLAEAGRYMGANGKVKESKEASKSPKVKSGSARWKDAIKQRKTPSSQTRGNAGSAGARKSSGQERPHLYDRANSQKSVYRRLTRYKRSQKDGEGRGA
jgi:hypothetical protein